ncbi:MAG: class I SAM-dependent methyltransferase [Myxococcota bacterium]
MQSPVNQWNPRMYEQRARFVREGGVPVLELLAPQAGERVLDLGCGDGKLTRALAERGASVVGVDASASMLEEARVAYPELDFRCVRGEELTFDTEFDAVFSNAALHWMPQADAVAAGMFRALRSRGRLAAEFGGYANVACVREAVAVGLNAVGRTTQTWNPWYFPRLGEYAALLERSGFLVRLAHWFERPSPMPDSAEQSGVASWLSIFANELLSSLSDVERPAFLAAVEAHAKPQLFRDGVWWIDYVRLRVEAIKP